MNKSQNNTQKLAIAGILCAVAVVGSMFGALEKTGALRMMQGRI